MKKEKGFAAEFKKFILRGNVIDLAVGVIIGGAFQSIVKSLVDDIIMPLVGMVMGNVDFSQRVWKIGDGEFAATVSWGNFVTAIINFLIMAFVIFLIVKAINTISDKNHDRKHKNDKEPAPTTKKCPYCKTEIDIDAVRCPNCTSELKEQSK